MEKFLTTFIEEYGYLGVMLLIALENVFPPIPSEVILTFSGFMTTKTSLSISGVIIASTIGSIIGAVILYLIGNQLVIGRLEKIIDKWGKVLRLKKKDIYKADAWFDKYGPFTVFFCRFIPLIRSLISIPAGMSKMKFGIFIILTTLGTLVWNVVLVYLGASVGSSWEDIVNIMEIYSNIIYATIVVLVIGIGFIFIRKRLIK
ncbi:DedA family protein [Litchfieldia salsa]|uniref:Membrane protein DedA, SNARE-associated domain n=1 Tax=Litchfieldia salsa TaxID=930152 RepID=A0A1H0UPQ4_9BACI|nr:DedA family protein [Litchfieldia salsa]SDP68085.1 membrane protein DedA, SNARE-associated domain [Litchfieldia salsa]